MQRAPLTAGNADGVTSEDKAVRAWNAELIKMSDALRAKHPDATSLVFSTSEVYNKVLDDPLSYPQTKGLKDTKEFCGTYPDFPQSSTRPAQGCKYGVNEYFWYNNLHPTSPIHDATAAELAKLLSGWPANAGKSCASNDVINATQRQRWGRVGKRGIAQS
jgi:phospholipase/lecithinase/hemolysin